MTFDDRIRVHDAVLEDELPSRFGALGIQFHRQGYEIALAKNDMVITHLEDSTAHSIRFRSDGFTVISRRSYFTELKTKLETQPSPNYDFEMSPWEKATASHEQGDLVAYIFWPALKVCWVIDAKPDWIGVPKWRWNEQDWLRVKHRYNHICPVRHIEVSGGSGTIFGIVSWDRIRAMPSFDQFWQEVQGKWQAPKQSRFL